MAKLTTSDITTRNAAIVRDFAAGGVTKAALAKKYGVDEKTIRRAIKAAGAAKPAKTDVKSSVKAKAQKAVGKSSKAGVQTCAKDAAQPSAKSGQKTDPTSLAVGYKVRMSEAGKKRWSHWINNPHDQTGKITNTIVSLDLPYEVQWENGHHNTYRADDLELVEEPKAFPVAVTSPATGVKAALASGQEVAYIITGDSIVLTLGNDTEIVDSSHANYQPIKVAIVSGDFKTAYDLMNISRAIESFTQGAIKIVGGEMYYGELLLKSALVDRILAMMGEGDEGFKKLVAFMERLLNNPSQRSVQELWGFISHLDIEITTDGYIVGWKKVRSRDGRLFDSHTGKVPNDIGNIVEMPRFMVDDNKNQTCSQGLHVGAWDYVSSFSGDTILKVLVDPADVVSVPTDYNDMKMRAAKYTVLTAVDSNRKEITILRNKNVKHLHVKVGERGEILSSVEI